MYGDHQDTAGVVLNYPVTCMLHTLSLKFCNFVQVYTVF